jgi:hypothetical protein
MEFFTKSKYDFIGVEFNYDALTEITSENFAKEVKQHLVMCNYIKRFHQDGPFFTFYAEDMQQTESLLLTAYFSDKYGEYFRIDTISSSTLAEMGLQIVKEEPQ